MQKTRSWQEIYKNEVPYYRALRLFVDREKFGLADQSGTPFHVNSANDPYPDWHKQAGCRTTQKLRHRDVLNHLEGTSALFVVNTPRRLIHEVTFDIDALDGVVNPDSLTAARFLASEVHQSYVPFIERSRNGEGAYTRMLVKRRASTTPEAFNELMVDFAATLQERHERRLADLGVKLCKIGGTLWHRKKNPKFDPPLFEKEGKEYLWRKRTYIGHFQPDERLEQVLYHRGSLICAPTFRAYALGNADLYERWIDWATFQPQKKVVDENWLRQCVVRWRAARPRPNSADYRPQQEGRELTCISHIDSRACDPANAYDRGLRCWFGLCRRLRRDATLHEFHATYVEQGLNTGADVVGRRDRRFRQIMARYPYNAALDQPKGFHKAKDRLVEMISHMIAPEHWQGVKYKNKLDVLDLAIGLALIERNAFGINDDPELQYTTGHKAMHGWFDRLYADGVTDRRANPDKCQAIKMILLNMGLIRYVDSRWRAKGEYGGQKYKGISQKFGIGPQHPRAAEFERVLAANPPPLSRQLRKATLTAPKVGADLPLW